MSDSTINTSIKKISIKLLRPGMFIHDLDCGWMDHPFLRSQFEVRDAEVIQKLQQHGISEVYINTSRGLDIVIEPGIGETQEINVAEPNRIEQETAPFKAASLFEEKPKARLLLKEATQIVHTLFSDIRLGKQIEVEKLEPLVEGMIDSIFRNPDAMLPLARLKEHDQYTFQHSVSVCGLMIAFARGLKLDRSTLKEIAIGALLHDVGKAKVPDNLLNKPAKLTDAELLLMKSHVVQSILLLQNTPGISQVALDVAAQHHERFDGTGYPNKLKGDEISLYGQMGAIIDVYDALTSDRAYHKGISPTHALGKLLEWSKNHFSPNLVQTYIKTIGIYPTGTLVRLESGKLAIVTEQNPEKSLMPVVRVIYNSQSRHYVEPELVDLSRPLNQDSIVGHESFDAWRIDPTRWK
jgi:putative nucleotidyltransferase with HDIG domain